MKSATASSTGLCHTAQGVGVERGRTISIDVKNVFYVFLFWSRFYVFILQTFFILKKNVGKVQSGKQINKKHFQNNSNEIDLWFISEGANVQVLAPVEFAC